MLHLEVIRGSYGSRNRPWVGICQVCTLTTLLSPYSVEVVMVLRFKDQCLLKRKASFIFQLPLPQQKARSQNPGSRERGQHAAMATVAGVGIFTWYLTHPTSQLA